MVGGPKRPGAGQASALQQSGDRMNHGDIEKFRRGQRWQQAGQALGQHRLAGTGRTHHQKIVIAGRRDLERPLCPLLTLDLMQIDIGSAFDQFAGHRPVDDLAALEMIDQLNQRRWREYGQFAARPGCFGSARLRANQGTPRGVGGDGSGQGAGRRPNAGIGAQLPKRQIILGDILGQDIEFGEDPDCNGQVEMRTFLGLVRRGEIDDQPLGRQRQAEGREGSPDPLATFRHRLVRETHYGKNRLRSTRNLNLYIHKASFGAMKGHGGCAGCHDKSPGIPGI